jgi:aspartate aminotransferase
MKKPKMSKHFRSRKPSAIRLSQIEFLKRTDRVKDINTAIGNVSLPTHPAMQKRMFNLSSDESPFRNGIIKYTPTVGLKETNDAFLHVIASSGVKIDKLYSQITDGGSQAMELIVLGLCGPAGSSEKPLLLIDPAYTNYLSMANRCGRKTVSVKRKLQKNGVFTLPDIQEIKKVIEKYNPGAMIVIPYDNPTGHYCDHDEMVQLAKLCVKYDMWMVSDEAYRELYYHSENNSSIWKIDNSEVSGIEGRRISIETTSKVWNSCGLRIGALVTDNLLFHEKAVAENTANLCSNAIGQYIFGAIAHESFPDLQNWYKELRNYYKPLLNSFSRELQSKLPGVIVSSPDASIYSVVDVRNIADPDFKAMNFVDYCASKGRVKIKDKFYTLLVAPMSGFYTINTGEENPGDTQMRIAYVPVKEEMALVPELFSRLFKEYIKL